MAYKKSFSHEVESLSTSHEVSHDSENLKKLEEPCSRRAMRFGIELELFIRIKEKSVYRCHKLINSNKAFEWEDVADFLVAVLECDCQLKARVTPIRDPEETYDEWIIRKEFSIIEEEVGFFGIEIVSPILETGTNWTALLRSVWISLENSFDIHFSLDCATHFHISPLQNGWKLSSAKYVAKAVIYFDLLIGCLLPRDRYENSWCLSNTSAPQVREDIQSSPQLGFHQAFKHIDAFDDIFSLVAYISPNKCHSWNFKHIVPRAKCGTIEFRRPIMTKTCGQLLQWAFFTIGFVRASQSMATDWTQIASFRQWPEFEALHAFVSSGILAEDGIEAFELVDALFQTAKFSNP